MRYRANLRIVAVDNKLAASRMTLLSLPKQFHFVIPLRELTCQAFCY